MTEQEVREGLRFALSGEPTPAFNPDVVIATARREIGRRRALIAAGVATVLVLAAAVAVPIAISPRSVPAASAPTTKPLSAEARRALDFAWPPPDVIPAHYSTEQLRERGEQMRAWLSTRFAAVVLAATQVAAGPFAEGQAGLENMTTFIANGVRSGVRLRVFASGADGPKPTEQCAEATVLQCDVIHQQTGASLVLQVTSSGRNLSGALVATVTQFRADGTIVSASAYNYDPSVEGRMVFQPGLPVSNQQLVALVTDLHIGL